MASDESLLKSKSQLLAACTRPLPSSRELALSHSYRDAHGDHVIHSLYVHTGTIIILLVFHYMLLRYAPSVGWLGSTAKSLCYVQH